MSWKSMNYALHLETISQMLRPYEQIWNNETLNNYPHSLNSYQEDWIESLASLTQEQLWKFDSKTDYSPIKGSALNRLLIEINSLTKLPHIRPESFEQLPEWAFVKVNLKKQHEISCLLPLLKEQTNIVDIGGGVGHLCRILSHYYGKKTLCLEKQEDLITIGTKRIEKYPVPQGAAPVKYVRAIFGDDNTDNHFSENTFSVGLHTCGSLAVEHIRSCIRNRERGMLNFGCCYPKIISKEDQNLSQVAKKSPLYFNEFGLTLATRSHSQITLDEYQLKERVKLYRYNLHLFCYFERDIKKFMAVGNTPLRIYRGDFIPYAQMNLERLGLSASENELKKFFNDINNKKLVNKMYLANLIRWQFGRMLEHYILTDRALYLEENGYTVELKEYFDEAISPRNIGLSAKRACRNT